MAIITERDLAGQASQFDPMGLSILRRRELIRYLKFYYEGKVPVVMLCVWLMAYSRDEISAALIDFHDMGDSYWTPENISKW